MPNLIHHYNRLIDGYTVMVMTSDEPNVQVHEFEGFSQMKRYFCDRVSSLAGDRILLEPDLSGDGQYHRIVTNLVNELLTVKDDLVLLQPHFVMRLASNRDAKKLVTALRRCLVQALEDS